MPASDDERRPARCHLAAAVRSRDEDASVALWLRTWQAAYPELDFAARLDWWRERWRNELACRPPKS